MEGALRVAAADIQANTPSATWARQAFITGRAQMSIRFQVDTAGFVQQVGWYQTAGADVRPTKIGFYAAGVLVWSQVAVIEDVDVPGWQWNNVPVKIELQPGTTYAVSIDTPNPGGSTFGNPADRFDPPDPFLWDDGMSHTNISLMPSYPLTIRLDQTVGINVTWEDLSHIDGQPPTGQANIAEALLDWLDPTAATKPTEDEKLYPRAMAKIDATDLESLAGDVAQMLIDLADLGIATSNDFESLLTSLKSWLGWTADNNTAVRRPDGTNVLDDTQAIITGQVSLEEQLNTMQASITAILNFLTTAEGSIGAFPTGWTLLAEEEWEGSIAFEEPAHLYVVNVTTPPAHGGHLETAAGLWLPRLGWWTELNGSQAGARGFLEFSEQQLHANGRAMAGCALVCKPDAAGTIQAWGAP